jgi:hypothetical protein
MPEIQTPAGTWMSVRDSVVSFVGFARVTVVVA